METPKKYFQDKLILLLVSSNIFLAFLCVALVFLRLGQGGGESYIVEYRSNLGISAFSRGDVVGILGFVVFSLLVAAINVFLSMRTYYIRRLLSLMLLSSGLVLIIFTLIISNALLILR